VAVLKQSILADGMRQADTESSELDPVIPHDEVLVIAKLDGGEASR
jgi:hypothetical protein